MKEKQHVEIKDKVLLSFPEASEYFGIGANKLRTMANNEENPKWILWNGRRSLIKRTVLEEILLDSKTI